MRALDIGSSFLASSLRGWRGTQAFRPARRQPERPLALYEFEACPYCRRVREVLTELDLDALIYPCPAGGSRFRPRVAELGGKLQFPFLVDPNTGVMLYESADIAAYLARTYDGRTRLAPALLDLPAAAAASALRGRRGRRARPSRPPQQPLELYSFESSPYSRRVREALCELELPYLLRNTGKALWRDMGPPGLRRMLFPDAPVLGRNRRRLLERYGRVQLPMLVDPDHGVAIFESDAILEHLQRYYAR